MWYSILTARSALRFLAVCMMIPKNEIMTSAFTTSVPSSSLANVAVGGGWATTTTTTTTSSALDATLYPVSGVDSLPEIQQALVFAGVYVGLGVGTVAFSGAADAATRSSELFAKWRTTWPLLGAVYVLAGVAHFGVSEAFESIYPPPGTWGLWYLPGSPSFHVAWTGVAEAAGGAGLLAGGAGEALLGGDDDDETTPRWTTLRRASAAALAGLTLAVTPANIYMYTHGAIMVGAGPDAPLELQFHAIRFAAQILLLGILAGMATSDGTSSTMETTVASKKSE